MPSLTHEGLVLLFRNRPDLVAKLLRDAVNSEVPEYSKVRLDSADLTDVQPAEYRADLVVLLLQDEPVLGIIVEVQLQPDEDKRYTWPVYVSGLRARLRCPVSLLVITPDERVADWARQPIDLGGDNQFRACVLGPAAVPQVTEKAAAKADPELAVLSAIAHGRKARQEIAIAIATAAREASADLDEQRATLYHDLILNHLTEAARKAFEDMRPDKYEYQSEFARKYVAQGKAEGKAEGIVEGRLALVLKLLTLRFGKLSQEIEARLRASEGAELEAIAERILQSDTLDEALGRPAESRAIC